MTENKENIMIPDEIIMNQIYYIRGHKVMLDTDFPEDFMFELTPEEY